VAERLAREADADQEKTERKHAEAAAAHAAAMQGAKEEVAVHAAKCRETSEAEREMAGRLAAAEGHMSHLRSELSAKNDTLGWMERTVTGVKEEVASREVRELAGCDAESSLGDAESSLGVTLRARWVTLRARWGRR
jgi:hypothetical protein